MSEHRDAFRFGRNIGDFKKFGYMWGTPANRWRFGIAFGISIFTACCHMTMIYFYDITKHPHVAAHFDLKKQNSERDEKINSIKERRKKVIEKLQDYESKDNQYYQRIEGD